MMTTANTTNKERVLEVRDLRILFRTNNGTVKAVRDIGFTLDKGETLAIVGESGSGKSVTARAIMGISAGNSIYESGEIFFDGMDLAKISEEDFQQLRGNRISMIFQDPFSSLNPIVRIGRQLTEAMIFNNRINRRVAKKNLAKRTNSLMTSIMRATEHSGKKVFVGVQSDTRGNSSMVLQAFAQKASQLEKPYIEAKNNIFAQISTIDGILIDIIRGEPKAIVRDIGRMSKLFDACRHKFLIQDEAAFSAATAKLASASSSFLSKGDEAAKTALRTELTNVKDILQGALELPEPNFFAMGYIALSGKPIPESADITKMNADCQAVLDEEFLNDFISQAALGVKFAHTDSLHRKKVALDNIEQKIPMFENENADLKELKRISKGLVETVEASINTLALAKDSFTYTFKTGIETELEKLVRAVKVRGRRWLSKKDREFAERADVDLYRANVVTILTRIRDSYRHDIESSAEIDYVEMAKGTIERVRADASSIVYKVTKRLAKSRAISLMEEVGIPEARARYTQYPFQFSGGMRQRIVIAIALAANPDLIICDEPSTALDVTIQAQILDLINNLKEKRGLSVIFITHDLGVVANVADRLAVMYAGKIVEIGTADEIYFNPQHPYTWALLSSMPDLETDEKLDSIPGAPPNMIFPPKGDAFAVRNKYALEIDFEKQPPFFEVSPTHKAATWLLHPDAPKVERPRILAERIKRMTQT